MEHEIVVSCDRPSDATIFDIEYTGYLKFGPYTDGVIEHHTFNNCVTMTLDDAEYKYFRQVQMLDRRLKEVVTNIDASDVGKYFTFKDTNEMYSFNDIVAAFKSGFNRGKSWAYAYYS